MARNNPPTEVKGQTLTFRMRNAESAATPTGSSALVYVGVFNWPGGLDLAPDAMRDSTAQRGEFVLR